jgi:hypothetical protein
MLGGDELVHTFESHVGSKEEELDRDELLRPPFGRRREESRAGEAPDNDEARNPLDSRVDPETDQRDRAGKDAGRDRDRALGAYPDERELGEESSAPCSPKPVTRWSRELWWY